MSYKALQTALKAFKAEGRTSIKLNATKVALQAEYDRLTVIEPEVNPTTDNEIETDTSEIVIDEPLTISITYHSFRDILRQRKPLYTFRKAQGFRIVKPEKRYDQLSLTEWLWDTLAFLDDMVYDECDYIAA
jgi:phosphatidylglycerophosphatase A